MIPRNTCRQNTHTHKAFFIIKYNLMEPGLEAPAIVPMQDNLCDIIKEEASLEYQRPCPRDGEETNKKMKDFYFRAGHSGSCLQS